jgi:gliding motility associated protien GldN
MKSKALPGGLILLSFCLLPAVHVDAQRKQAGKRPQPAQIPAKKDSVPTLFGLPLIMDTSSIFDASSATPPLPSERQRIPLPYPPMRFDDALYVQKVWEELDFNEKINQVFRYDAFNDGSQLFINLLLRAVRSGEVTAFQDERFSKPMSVGEITMQLLGQLDTVPRVNPNTGVPDAYIVTRSRFDPQSVTRLRIMEDWVFDRNYGRMVCRIIGIAPIKLSYRSQVKDRAKEVPTETVLFWLHYPDLRPMLANVNVYNPKNQGQSVMTWEELFESRMFSGFVVKSTLDNPGNKAIRATVKDPVIALLKGDNVKQKIFNYEQDLWSN